MASLISVMHAAVALNRDLFEKAEDEAFDAKQQTAFFIDGIMVGNAASKLSNSPRYGYDAAEYEPVLVEIRQARGAVAEVRPADAGRLHSAHLETVQARQALTTVTA